MVHSQDLYQISMTVQPVNLHYELKEAHSNIFLFRLLIVRVPIGLVYPLQVLTRI